MNLFRKQKFSIRKFNIGIFSALIATVTFLSHPGQASASELDSTQSNNAEENNASESPQTEPSVDKNRQQNDNATHGDTNQDNASNQTQNNDQTEAQIQNGEANQAQPNNEEVTNENSTVENQVTETSNHPNELHVDDASRHHIEAKPKDKSDKDVSHTSQPVTSNTNAIVEESNIPKKRGKRSAPTYSSQSVTNSLNDDSLNTDPNLNNTGRRSPKMILTFDDLGISTSTDRNNPKVTVVNSLDGFTMINGGKVGLVNAIVERTDVFDSGDPKNAQAQGNVLVLGRAKDTDTTDHGDFYGIEKTITVNPKSEVIFDFNTMTPKSRQSGTDLVIKDANTDQVLVSTLVEGGNLQRLFKVPDNVSSIKIQFKPNNDVMTKMNRVKTLEDGYKYYDFIDTIGINSGSHLFISKRNINQTAKNNTDFTVITTVTNDGNFGASLKDNDFVYTINLPNGIEYVENSLSVTTPDGNVVGYKVNPMDVNYDKAQHTVTISSRGINKGSKKADDSRLVARKSLRLQYKLRVNNITTPQAVTFTDKINYKTLAEENLNGEPNENVVNSTPYNVDIVMNKEQLQLQVNKEVIPSNYTYASVQKFNQLKLKAEPILEEETDGIPIDERKSQAEIDQLTNEMSTALINRLEATKKINDKAQDMSDATDDNDLLTEEEKDKNDDIIDQHKQYYNNKIDDQLTDEGVRNVVSEGINALNGDVAVPHSKPNAIDVINNKARDQKLVINNDNEATQEEKNVAIQQVDTHSADAIKKINDARTDSKVTQFRDEGVTSINSDVTHPQQKSEARKVIEGKAHERIANINNNQEATQDEKDHAISNVNQAKDQAIQNINQANTNNNVADAKTNGVHSLEQLSVTPIKKQTAIAEINKKAQQQKQKIQNYPDATNEEKTAAETIVDQAVATAIGNINQASTNAIVDQAQTNGETSIASIEPDVRTKQAARNAIESKATSQLQQITANSNATNEEKEVARNNVASHKQQALTNIDLAHSNQEVQSAQQEGINTINQDLPNAVKKNKAIEDLRRKVQEKKATNNQTTDATNEEIETANNKVDEALNNGIQQINQADTNNKVDQALNDASQTIDRVTVDVEKKNQARQAITSKYNEKQNTINHDNEGTTEEKQLAIQNLTNAKDEAERNISNATTNHNVDVAQQNGLSNISNIIPSFTKKQQARTQINDKFKTKEAQINATPDATDDEKNDAINKLTQAKNQALENVNQAQSDRGVEDAQNNGVQSLENINATVIKKQQAKTEIGNIAQQHNQQIQHNQNATTEEQEAAVKLVNAALNNINNNINNAHTNNQVDTLVQSGTQSINAIQPETKVKANAKHAVDDQASKVKQKIQTVTDATDEERNEAIQKVEQAQTLAKDNIQTANTNSNVSQAESNGIDALNAINAATTVKTEARNAIQNKVDQQIALINQTHDATKEEKQVAIDKVKNEQARVLEQINVDHTTQTVNNDKDNAIQKINQITAQAVIKQTARDEINQKAIAQKEEINNNNNSTDEEKLDASNKVEAAKQEALNNIDSVSTSTEVESAKAAGLSKIAIIQPSTQTKTNAKQDIDNKLSEHISTINAHQTATTEEKDTAIQLANQKANEAKSNIQKAHDNSGVNSAKTNGLAEINKVEPDARQKTDAKQAIDTKVNEQTKVINVTPDATDEEKAEAHRRLITAQRDGDSKVDQSQSNQNVTDAKTEAINSISSIHPTVSKKPDANSDIDQKFEASKQIINNTPNATTEEKAEAIQKLSEKKDDIKNKISQATKNNDVDQIKTSGINDLESIHATPVKKAEAIQAVNEKVNSQNSLIINENNATDEEKEVAKSRVNVLKTKTIDNINQAQSNQQVETAKDNGMNEIATILPATTIKTDAKNAIEQKAQQQIAVINNNNDSTNEEKLVAIQLVENAKHIAEDNITSDHTTQEVNDEKAHAIEKISSIQPSTEVKTNARNELKQTAQDQKTIINQTADATEEEKQDAINQVDTDLAQALQNVNDASTTNNVNAAKQNGISKIQNVQVKVAKKPTAIASITQKANDQKAMINNESNATEDEKNDARRLVDEKLNESRKNINNSSRNSEIDSIQTQALKDIQSIHAQAHKKQDAISRLTSIAENKKADIRANQNATTEEKNEAYGNIEQALEKAKNDINGASTNAQVDEKVTSATKSLEQIEVPTQKKTSAKNDISQAVYAQKELINSNQNATNEEKQDAINQLTREEATANSKILTALANQNVDDVKNDALQSIKTIQPNIIKKPQAQNIINQKTTEQSNAINNNQNATTEEKNVALVSLDRAKSTALQNIAQAHTNEEVQTAENNGVEEITKIVPETTVKLNAKKQIENTAQAQIKLINNTQKSTTEEKQDAIQNVNNAKDVALNNIAQATTTQLVNDAQNSGVTNISQIQPATTVKTNAIESLKTEARNKNALLDQTPNATEEEKEEANNKVDQLQEDADAKILNADTTEQVNKIKAEAIQNIENVQVDVVKKQAVKDKLNQLVKNQKQVIVNTPGTTTEEKDDAIKTLNNELNNATNAINNANHNNEVDSAFNEAKPKIEAIVPQAEKKPAAYRSVQISANEQIQEIKHTTEATSEEKEAALTKVSEALKEANKNIGNAQSNDEVATAQRDGSNAIARIKPDAQVKAKARETLNGKYQEVLGLIENNPNSTLEEKTEAKKRLSEELKHSLDKISQADNNKAVEDIVNTSSQELLQIKPSTAIKDQAKADVNTERDKKHEAITKNNDATTEEKAEAELKLTHAADEANQAIGDASDTNAVNVERNKGVNTIRDINPIIVKKPTAKAAIDKEAKTKRDEIQNTPNSTHDETLETLNQLDQVVKNATNKVDEAQTNDQVVTAQQDGVNKISNVKPVANKKKLAIDEINQAKQNKLDEINQAYSATSEEKESARQFVNTEAQKAMNQISESNTNADVDTAKNSGLNTIKQYTPEYNKKKNAILKLYDLTDAQEAIINAYPDATDEEKRDATNKVEALLLDAKKQIGFAKDNAQVDDIYVDVSKQIKLAMPNVTTKSDAREILKSLAKQLIHTFEETPDVTDEERNDAISQVNDQLNNVLRAIDKDSKDIQVAQEKTFGLNYLNNIVINVIQKPAARKAVNTKADEVIKSINNTPNATDEEKLIALDKVKQIVNDANTRIHKAKSDSEVMLAKTEAITLLSSISPEVQEKPSALEGILSQARVQKDKINQNNQATQEEKESAIQTVDQLIKQGEERLDMSSKNQQVNDVKLDIIDKISKVKPNVVAKPEALKQILSQLDNQKIIINSTEEATEEEKTLAIDELINLSNKFAARVDNAQTNAEVESAETESIQEISHILPKVNKKPEARKELEHKAEDIRTTITSNDEATLEEKNEALKTLSELVKKANDSTTQSNTNEDVDKAKSLVLPQIEAINVKAVVKPQAKDQIQTIANNKQNKFEHDTKATKEEKQIALNQLAEAVKEIINTIHNAQTNAEVSHALKEGLAKLDLIEVEAHKKLNANAYLQGLSDEKISEIEADNDATLEEKDMFTYKVKDLLSRIQQAVNDSETNEDVDEKVKQFKIELNKLDLKAHKKAAAKHRIEQKAYEIIQIIDSNTKASLQAKKAAKVLVAKILDEAMIEIDEADTNLSIDKIVEKTIEKLNNIKVKNDLVDLTTVDECNYKSEYKKVSTNNSNKESLNQLPETGEADSTIPLAGSTLAIGAALIATRKLKKDKKS